LFYLPTRTALISGRSPYSDNSHRHSAMTTTQKMAVLILASIGRYLYISHSKTPNTASNTTT
jgi:hypothetical protein